MEVDDLMQIASVDQNGHVDIFALGQTLLPPQNVDPSKGVLWSADGDVGSAVPML